MLVHRTSTPPSFRTIAGLLSAALVVACSAEAGPVGPQGPEGPQGPIGPGGTPSISAVFPLNIYLEHEDTVILSGSSTQWDASTTLDLGAGITVSQLTVASPTAMVALVEADSTAALGPRNVTVRSDADTTVFANAFRVDAPIDIDFTGTLRPGARVIGEVTLRNLNRPFPEPVPGSTFVLRTYTPEEMIQGSVAGTPAGEIEIRYFLPLNAPAGPVRFAIEETLSGTKWRSAAFDMLPSSVLPGPYGASLDGLLTQAGESDVYRFDARAGQMVAVTVTSASDGFTQALFLPDSTHDLGQTFYALEDRTWFTTVYELQAGQSSSLDYKLQIDTLTVTPPKLEAVPTTGSLNGLWLTDVYTIDLAVGQTLTVSLSDGPTDTCATIDAGLYVRDPAGRMIASELGGCTVLTTSPVETAGTHTVFVLPNPVCACSFDYRVAAILAGAP